MAPLKVDVVPGIGRFRKRILLQELSITRVRELAALDVDRLGLVFGREASLIHQRAVGIDLTPVYPVPAKPMINDEIAFSEDENDDSSLLSALYSMVERCARVLRTRALVPGRAGLLIRYSDQVEVRREMSLRCAGLLDLDLYFPLEKLFLRTCNRRVRIRFMRVWFRDFSPESSQLSLFHIPSHQVQKQSLVIQALDRVRERHGEGAIRFGRAA